MAIRDWHSGQLVVFLVAAFLVGWAGLALADIGDDAVEVVGLVLFVGALVSGLVVAWRWFGARRKPN